MAAGRGLLQALDRWSARRVTHFAGISRYVAQRIARVYGRQARVIYPRSPQDARGAVTAGRREGFLLYLGRLVRISEWIDREGSDALGHSDGDCR